MDAQSPRKRKRSAIACTRCHDRKVRCSAAFQGFPCANCAQDGTPCTIYQAQSVRSDLHGPPTGTGSDVRQKPTPAYPPTPSPSLVYPAEVSQRADTISNSGTTIETEAAPTHVHVVPLENHRLPIPADDIIDEPRRARSDRHARDGLAPFYAGEAEGLEFLFDICSPNRPIRGSPYIIGRNVHKRQRFRPEIGSRPNFPPHVATQFLRCFFHYVYPFMPVVNAGEFISKYTEDPNHVSALLLWSVFFAAASYVDNDVIDASGCKTRKLLKEFCYQNAKAVYDAQLEPDKTTIIASTLLLAYWYVDLEDIDGTGHWLGIAIHLCCSIGLHREPNYDRLPRCPFTLSQRALWRRLWWCSYYRDAWYALGSGRPMRAHIDDCDLQLPTVRDIIDDLAGVPVEMRTNFLPAGLEDLALLWTRLLQLSIKLEYAMALHYRPRRPPLSIPQLETDYADTLRLLHGLEPETDERPKALALHYNHFKCYVKTVAIILYRSYMLSSPTHLAAVDRLNLEKTAVQACKTAAADITSTINKLIAEDMIETSPTTLVTCIVMAMQIHFFELAKSEGLLRQHALHNMNLHFMVLTSLKKTFWTADMNYNLFNECVKALNSGSKTESRQYAGYAAGLQDPTSARSSTPQAGGSGGAGGSRDEQNATAVSGGVLETSGLNEAAYDEFFASFGPFDNFSCLFDERLDYNGADASLG